MKSATKNLLFITLISSLFLIILILIKQQNYSANTQTLALTDYQPKQSKTAVLISPIYNKELSCSDCSAQGKDTICFNVETNRATCGNANYSQNINTLCRKCSTPHPKPTIFVTPIIPPDKCYYMQRSDQQKPILICPSIMPKPTCIPRPSCLDQNPRCMLAEPIGGWCPKKPTITPQYCLQVLTPARNLTTKECKTFSSSCIPEGWMRDSTCSNTPPATQ